jgi:hypothetical protein
MIFIFAGLGLVLVGTIYIGSVVFGIEPQRKPVEPTSMSAPFIVTPDKESP